MADAVPSRVGDSPTASVEKIHLPVVEGEEIGRNKKGMYVKRTTFDNGEIREDFLCEKDAPADVKWLDKKTERPDPRPIPKPKKKGS